MPVKLIITNGTPEFTVDLLKLNLQEWLPTSPAVKNDGVWVDSPLADGRRLAQKKFGNVTDTFLFEPSGYGQNIPMNEVRILGQLLEMAVSYFTSEWQETPVWIEAQMTCEAESVKALIYDYRLPTLDDPTQPPFANVSLLSTIEDFTLILEHSNWTDVAPGDEVCVKISSQGAVNIVEVPTQSTDDAYITKPAATINTAATSIQVGRGTGSTSYDLGVRFRNVSIPAGARIVRAYIRFTGSISSSSGIECSAKIVGQRNIAPATFSTYADFVARQRTTNKTYWYNIPLLTPGTGYNSPDITQIIQEIIDLPGWASGNNLVVFMENAGNIRRRTRNFASFDHATYPEPTLFVEYVGTALTDVPIGFNPTCEPVVYVPNHFQKAQLTHVFYYDASIAAFSLNLIGAVKPTQLLPNPVATGDMIYFIISSAAVQYGPFDNIVLNIDPALDNTGGTAVWEYLSNPVGPVFTTLPRIDNTDFLQQAGTNSVNFEKPASFDATPWVVGTVNAVTGWVIRLRYTNVIGVPTPPYQADLEIFSSISPWALIDKDEIKGDRYSPVHIRAINTSDGSGYLTSPDHKIKSFLASSRSTSRGAEFCPFLNISQVQLLNGQNTSVSGPLTTWGTDISEAPTGSSAFFAPVAVTPSTLAASIDLDNNLAQQYKGTFRMFLRCYQDGGAGGDMSVQIKISTNGIVFYESDLVYVENDGYFVPLDFGPIELPPSMALMKTAPPQNLKFDIFITNSNAVPGFLELIDLALMPTDEFSGEYIDPIGDPNSSFLGQYGGINRLLDIDPLTVPKVPIAAILRQYASDNPYLLRWVEIQPEWPFLQVNTEQKLYFFSRGFEPGQDIYLSETGINLIIQLYKNARYFWFKGDNL